MARDSIVHGASSWEEDFQWQRPPRPDEPEVRDVAVDPFSLRQFSRLDIDRPLPIPSVSVDDRHGHVSPARLNADAGSAPPGTAASSSSSPRLSIAGGLKAPAAPTGLDVNDDVPSGAAVPRSKVSAGWEAELAAAGLDVALATSKASEPQRWGSDVPLIAAAAVSEDYSFGSACKDGGRGNNKQAAKHAGRAPPPFTCCMYVPGLTRRIIKPPTPTAAAAARPYSSAAFGKAAAAASVEPGDPGPGTCSASARHSTVSLAVSLERFDCESLAASSRGLGLDDGEDEAASASSCFDLPLELILGCDDDDESNLPVCAAFLFDSDGVRKSVLKRRLEAGAGMEHRRPSLGKVSVDAPRISAHHVRVSLKSRSPVASTSQ